MSTSTMWLLLFVLVSCLRTLNCQFVRARNLVRLYALDGILCTLTNLGFNVLFLSGLKLGAQGWLLALICSDACSALFLFFVSSIWRYMGGRINTKLWRKMLPICYDLHCHTIDQIGALNHSQMAEGIDPPYGGHA